MPPSCLLFCGLPLSPCFPLHLTPTLSIQSGHDDPTKVRHHFPCSGISGEVCHRAGTQLNWPSTSSPALSPQFSETSASFISYCNSTYWFLRSTIPTTRFFWYLLFFFLPYFPWHPSYNQSLFAILECSKIAYMIINLTGRAWKWVTVAWERHCPVCDTLTTFLAALMKVR